MNKLLAAFCFCFFHVLASAQKPLRLDATGKVITLPILSAGTITGYNATVTIDVPEPQLESLRQALLGKMRRTRANLVDPVLSFKNFYGALWGMAAVDSIIDELDHQIAYLQAPGTQTFSYRYLPATAVYFDPIFVNWKPETYVQINKQPFQNPFALSATNYVPAVKAFKLGFYFTDPAKDFIRRFYNQSITQREAIGLRNMDKVEFYQILPTQLKSLKEAAITLSATPLESFTDKTKYAIDELHFKLTKNKLFQLVRSSNYFKNWIWLTEGEITLNPLEVKGRDTAGKKGNISLVQPISKATSLLTTVLVPVREADKRYLIYSSQPSAGISEDTAELKLPFTSKDQVAVIIKNIASNETVSVHEIKPEAARAQSSFMERADTAGDIIGIVTNQLHPTLGIWGKVFTAVDPLPKTVQDTGAKNAIDKINDAYLGSKKSVVTATNRQQLLNAIKKDLTQYHAFNPFLFQETITLLENIPDFGSNGVSTKAIKAAFVANFLEQYEQYFKDYAEAKRRLQTDSLIAANLYTILVRSNLPPAALEADIYDIAPKYRTEIHLAEPNDNAIHRYFTITKYLKAGSKVTDSSSIGSFDYKVGKNYLLRTSAGIAFTIPNKYYSQNTVSTEADGTIKVDSESETIRMIAGIHIYPARIDMQDEKFFGSKEHPWYTRLSIFVGLGIPKPLDNYYPGLSYDIIPGLRLIGGAHLYRHKRYMIENNVIMEQTAMVKFAGGFVSLNLDPAVAVKALGFFNK